MGVGLQDEEKALETLMSKRSALQAKRTELERKIKDLGSLPAEAFEKYQDYPLQDLHNLLQKSNTQLKKFRLGSLFWLLCAYLSCLAHRRLWHTQVHEHRHRQASRCNAVACSKHARLARHTQTWAFPNGGVYIHTRQ